MGFFPEAARFPFPKPRLEYIPGFSFLSTSFLAVFLLNLKGGTSKDPEAVVLSGPSSPLGTDVDPECVSPMFCQTNGVETRAAKHAAWTVVPVMQFPANDCASFGLPLISRNALSTSASHSQIPCTPSSSFGVKWRWSWHDHILWLGVTHVVQSAAYSSRANDELVSTKRLSESPSLHATLVAVTLRTL